MFKVITNLLIIFISFQLLFSCGKDNRANERFKQLQRSAESNFELSPFIEACYSGKLETVKELISKGEDVNQRVCENPKRKISSNYNVIIDPACDDWYPITFAIYGGNHQVIKMLFDGGAKLDVVDRYGFSLLMEAVILKDRWTIEFLLNMGLDIDHQLNDGRTAIMLTDTTEKNEIYYLLKKKHAKIDFHSAIKHGDFELVKKLLSNNPALIDQPDREGWPPLILACIYSSDEIVRFLVKNNASINHGNKYKATAIMHAAYRNRIEIVRLLLDKGADVNGNDSSFQPLIIWAIRSKNIKIVKLIAGKGANINVIDSDGKTALDWAKNNQEMIDYLIEKGAKQK